ncbi:hypothetical protein L541_0506, partial [Bordetella hinzii CA90 BAL1384]
MGKIIFWFFAILVVLTAWRMLNARGSRRDAPLMSSGIVFHAVAAL